MSNINRKTVNDAYVKAYALIKNENMHERFASIKQSVLADETLTKDEKKEVIKRFDGDYDYFKVVKNDGTKRICENCQESCLATLYCEYCIRNYLKENCSNWTSENNEIDNILKKCQESSVIPYMIVEWIPYENLKNIEYLARGGFSEILSATWVDGYYKEWDLKEKKLKRSGECKVVLKQLENVERANRTWLEEAESHLYISNKWGGIAQCYGLTKHPSTGKFILVMSYLDTDLRKYIMENHNNLSWKMKIKIIFEIIKALYRIHKEGSVHRDLHSGNILYSREKNDWYISDLGFCGPADKPLTSIYGNLPYIAPEVLAGKNYGPKSDIYSIAMLMWELSSEQPPYVDRKHNYDLVINILNGIRPQIVPGTPYRYRDLMKRCWDADPEKRPDASTLWDEVDEIDKSLHENDELWSCTNSPLNPNFNLSYTTTTSLLTDHSHSKVYNFSSLPEPRNATEEEQEAYHTKQIDLLLPDDMY